MGARWEIWKDAVEWIVLCPFVVCCFGTVCVCNLCRGRWRRPFAIELCGTSRQNERERAEQRAREEVHRKNAPRPLPETRKRALTAPLPLTEEVSCSGEISNPKNWLSKVQSKVDGMQRTFDQSKSSLFSKLPPEVRRLIYTEVFVGNLPIVHIVRKYRRLGHLHCINKCTTRLIRLEDSCWGISDLTGDWIPGPTKAKTDGGMIPLLLACRRIYSEAIDLLYESNRFSFISSDILIHLSLTILPQRFNVIRKVHLTWQLWPAFLGCRFDLAEWDKACDVMASMRGLRFLQIDLDAGGLENMGNTINAERERGLLEPLMAVTMVKDFCVTLWWVPFRDQEESLMEGTPFRLIRRGDAVLWPSAQ
ncbi:hypothetical protein OEA41_000683 [Lepraria neglecta]|uniref:DUF7730 domain-containing protein n=1 Tax=Lepraria neglecta TaxID=209136 RepID=A0AAD9ZG78_9LECA|nr:hypothetical protein OEA41_000683 [Lepraria neglecta]